MSDGSEQTPPGWYYAAGDPPGTQRYWDGMQWQGGPQPVAGGGPGAVTAGGRELGSPVNRLLARIVDGFVIAIPVIVLAILFRNSPFIGGLLGLLVGGAYEIYLLGTRGATVGKSVMSLKVVNEDYSDITMETAVRRYAINVVQIIPVVGQILQVIVGIATIVMVFTDDRRQVPWDKIAKTLVVSTK